MNANMGEGVVGRSTLSLASATERVSWSTPRPGRFTPRKEKQYPLYRRLGGPQGWYGQQTRVR